MPRMTNQYQVWPHGEVANDSLTIIAAGPRDAAPRIGYHVEKHRSGWIGRRLNVRKLGTGHAWTMEHQRAPMRRCK